MSYRSLASILAALPLLMPAIGQAKSSMPDHTADYYQVNAAEYLGQEVQVYAYSAVLLDRLAYYHPNYLMMEVQTTYNKILGGSIPVAVSFDEVYKFKKKYTKQGEYESEQSSFSVLGVEFGMSDTSYTPPDEFSEKLKGILRIGKTQQGEQFLYIDTETKAAQEGLTERYLGKKITIQAHSAQPEISGTLDQIFGTKAFILKTSNKGIQNGRIVAVVPEKNMADFTKTFLLKNNKKSKQLSGYLYQQPHGLGSFQYLYCSNEPLNISKEKAESNHNASAK